MNRDPVLFELIGDYLRGILPAEEARAFETRLAQEPELASLVQQQRLEREGLERLVRHDLMAQMRAWENEVPQAAPMRVTHARRNQWWRIAAAAVVLSGVGAWLAIRLYPADELAQSPTSNTKPPIVSTKPPVQPKALPPNRPSPVSPSPSNTAPEKEDNDEAIVQKAPEKKPPTPSPTPKPATPDYKAIAATYYQSPDFNTAGAPPDEAASLDQAGSDFQNKNFKSVADRLKPLLKSNPKRLKTKEMLAHAAYESGRYDEAYQYFNELSVNKKDAATARRAQWSLALTLLHQMPAKRPLLEKVLSKITADPAHPYRKEALEVQKKIAN